MSSIKRVLLIDDDEDLLLTNRLALEAAGFVVESAISGAEGLRKANEGGFDVAVLDVIMETREQGFEVARALRQNPSTHDLRILMLTSVNADAERHGGYLGLSDRHIDDSWLPVDRFADKPLKPHRLVELVAELAQPRLPPGH
jgi:CheY-like chemotaxis protein